MALTDLYAILFGKVNIRDGDVISMAEHGRNGGLSTGQAFKFSQMTPMAVRQATNASLTIYGFAKPGVNSTEPYWRIMAEDVNGNITFATGSESFTNSFQSLSLISFS